MSSVCPVAPHAHAEGLRADHAGYGVAPGRADTARRPPRRVHRPL